MAEINQTELSTAYVVAEGHELSAVGAGLGGGFSNTSELGEREISLSTMSDDSQYWLNSDVVSTKMISVSRRVQIHRVFTTHQL